jgi:lipopolysaccharide transport system permease protein
MKSRQKPSAKGALRAGWTSVIRPKGRWFNISAQELYQYKDLVGLFVRRDFVAIYKQTVLGPLWFVIQPLVTTVLFTVIFGRVAGIPTDGVPHLLFYFSGNLVWHYFSATLVKISATFESNANMFGKVYFPRLTVPLSVLVTELITFAIQLAVFALLWGYFAVKGSVAPPTLSLLFLPLLVLQTAVLSLGVGIVVSSMTTRYRDLKYLLTFGVQLWMYGTPIVYPISIVPERWRWVFIINPMSAVTESFRKACFGIGGMSRPEIGIAVAATVVVLFVGLLLFGRIEKTFTDTV